MTKSLAGFGTGLTLLLLLGWGLIHTGQSRADDPVDPEPAPGASDVPVNEEAEQRGETVAAEQDAPPAEPLEDFSTEALRTLVDGMEDGTTLKVPRGRYTSKKAWTIKDKKNLTLIFTPDSEVICDDVYEDVVRIENCDGVRLVGGIFRHAEPLKEYECHGAVIRVRDSQTVKLMNGEYNGCGAVGVWASNVERLTVYNCNIHNNSWTGLYLKQVGHANLIGNHIHDNQSGMMLSDCGMIQSTGNKTGDNADYWNTIAELQKELKQLQDDPKIITPVPEQPEKR